MIINIVPLSVNKAWQGKRFKTKEYLKFERDMLLLLPKFKIPEAPISLSIHYGFSSKLSDIDNPTKLVIDIMQKKYNFNDKDIFELTLTKQIVNKGKEFIEINAKTYQKLS
jgi:Holliday junction resolvase RusA-like endonuclease